MRPYVQDQGSNKQRINQRIDHDRCCEISTDEGRCISCSKEA